MTSSVHAKQESRLRRVIIDALIVLGISTGLVVVGEVFIRAFFPQNSIGRSITGKRFSERDEALGMRYRPGAIWRFSHPEYEVQYSINEDGFRDSRRHPIPKPDGTTRVLLVGDSFTFGQGVNYEEIWSVIVEKRLEESGNNHIDLVKAGIQGMDTRSEFILMRRLLEKYQYDMVIVAFLINDLYTNTLHGIQDSQENPKARDVDQIISDKSNRSIGGWSDIAKGIFVGSGRNRTFHLLTLGRRIAIGSEAIYCKLYFMMPDRGDFLTIPLAPSVQEKLRITTILLEKMVDYLDALGKKLIVLSIPQQAQVLCHEQVTESDAIDIAFYDRYFSDRAKEHGFTWVTTLDAFTKSNHNKNELFYRFDGHLTPAGNEVVAGLFLREVMPLINEANTELR